MARKIALKGCAREDSRAGFAGDGTAGPLDLRVETRKCAGPESRNLFKKSLCPRKIRRRVSKLVYSKLKNGKIFLLSKERISYIR